MKNNLLLVWIIITIIAIGVSVFINYWFIIPRIEKNKYIPIEIYTYDTNSNNYNKIINESIEENINKMYDGHISHLNISITLFSVCLGIFTIIFGAFYILKISEIQKEINNIRNMPEEVFKKFYKEKLKDDIANLLSKNNIKRNLAIKGLSNNTEITERDFNLLEEVFNKEINSKNYVFYYNNIQIILPILINLDIKRTIKLIITTLEENEFDILKFNNLITFLFLDKENDLVKEYIKKSLTSGDINLYNSILLNIVNNDIIDEYIIFILENSSETAINYVIGYMYSYKLVIKDFTKLLLEYRKNLENENAIISTISGSNVISNIDKAEFLLIVYSKNKDKNDNSLYSYLYNISGNIEFRNEFKSIYYKNFASKLSLDDFFDKYKPFINKDDFI
ncbi:hypothetical protein [uncultured Brachyspira sp.]|uniref:hypothetical protein n=1 Tax=uncultured Brachyspira sp. TaxID=221953 RepID=UPI00258E3638|nr:hypothetical protein [uncultured Brachyspira sp.]